MGAFRDITGQRFSKLVVLSHRKTRVGKHQTSSIVWFCQCDCGATLETKSNELKSGHTKSCGCLSRNALVALGTKHGHCKNGNSRTYYSWVGMIDRCRRPTHTAYADYGGRGIKVCERWQKFENFLTDMGERPDGMTLDRYPNVNGHYEPDNCRWATNEQQRANQRARRSETYLRGEKHNSAKLGEQEVRLIRAGGKSDSEFAKDFGVHRWTIGAARRRTSWRHIP